MRHPSLCTVLALSGLLGLQTQTAPSSPSGTSGNWTIWSPRPEIAPQGSLDASSGELILQGGGNVAVFGGWQRTFGGIKGGQWYRLQVRYKAKGLGFEPLQTPVRLDWTLATGKRTGQPDYAWRVTEEKGWRLVSLDAPAPEKAANVNVQLLLQNAANATVRYKDITLTPIPQPPARNVNIASVRFYPRGPDPIAAFTALVDSQLAGKTDIVLLPEGATMVGTGKKYADVAEPVPGPTTARLGELARRKGTWVVAGVVEREGHALYNTAVLIDRAGKFAGKYRKVYLPREELEGGITPGSDYPVFDTDFGRIGIMICWDVQYPDPARALALRGAEVILMPIWDGDRLLAKARAIENHVFLVSSGYGFPAQVLDPLGAELASSEKNGTIVSATVDLNRRYADEWLGELRGRFFREVRGDLQLEPAGRK